MWKKINEWRKTGQFICHAHFNFVFKFFFHKFIYFWAALVPHCCVWAFSTCGEQGLLFIVVHGLFIAVASLVAEHGL